MLLRHVGSKFSFLHGCPHSAAVLVYGVHMSLAISLLHLSSTRVCCIGLVYEGSRDRVSVSSSGIGSSTGQVVRIVTKGVGI